MKKETLHFLRVYILVERGKEMNNLLTKKEKSDVGKGYEEK